MIDSPSPAVLSVDSSRCVSNPRVLCVYGKPWGGSMLVFGGIRKASGQRTAFEEEVHELASRR